MLVRDMRPDEILEINGTKIHFPSRIRITILTQAHIKVYDRENRLRYERQPKENK